MAQQQQIQAGDARPRYTTLEEVADLLSDEELLYELSLMDDLGADTTGRPRAPSPTTTFQVRNVPASGMDISISFPSVAGARPVVSTSPPRKSTTDILTSPRFARPPSRGADATILATTRVRNAFSGNDPLKAMQTHREAEEVMAPAPAAEPPVSPRPVSWKAAIVSPRVTPLSSAPQSPRDDEPETPQQSKLQASLKRATAPRPRRITTATVTTIPTPKMCPLCKGGSAEIKYDGWWPARGECVFKCYNTLTGQAIPSSLTDGCWYRWTSGCPMPLCKTCNAIMLVEKVWIYEPALQKSHSAWKFICMTCNKAEDRPDNDGEGD